MSAHGFTEEDEEALDIHAAYWDSGCWARREVGSCSVWLPARLVWPATTPDDPQWRAIQFDGRTLEFSFLHLMRTLQFIERGHGFAFDFDEWLDLRHATLRDLGERYVVSGLLHPRGSGDDNAEGALMRLPVVVLNEAGRWALTLFGPVRLGDADDPDEPDAGDTDAAEPDAVDPFARPRP